MFPFVFVSSAFVPLATFPSWLQPIAQQQPGDDLGEHWSACSRSATCITESTSKLFADVPSLGTLLWLSAVWIGGFLAFFSFLGVRAYRRT